MDELTQLRAFQQQIAEVPPVDTRTAADLAREELVRMKRDEPETYAAMVRRKAQERR